MENILKTHYLKIKKFKPSQGRKEYHTCNRTKVGYMDWSHIAQEMPSETRYRRNDRREEDATTKT